MATRPERKIRYEDYLRFPDGERWEVIDGEAYVVPSPKLSHQEVVGRLYAVVLRHVEEHGGGRVIVAPFDVVLSESDVVQPDVVFVGDREQQILTEAHVHGTPTWLVEVLSDPARDRGMKLQRYERFGVPEYWIVDPAERAVEVYRLGGGSYPEPSVVRAPDRLSPLQPEGLMVDLGALFRAS